VTDPIHDPSRELAQLRAATTRLRTESNRLLAESRRLRAEHRRVLDSTTSVRHHRPLIETPTMWRALRLADDAATMADEYRSNAAEFMIATAELDDETCESLFCGTDLALLGGVLLQAAWSLAQATGCAPEPLAPDERVELRWRFDW